MIYIVEGPDRVGKSTFINAMRSNIKNPRIIVIHSSKPPPLKNTYAIETWTYSYYNALINAVIELHNNGYDVILDRSWFSEYVYGPMYRNVHIDNELIESKCVGIHDNIKLCLLIDSAENLLSREDGESDARNMNDKLVEISLFERIYKGSIVNKKLMINWNNEQFNNENIETLANTFINM